MAPCPGPPSPRRPARVCGELIAPAPGRRLQSPSAPTQAAHSPAPGISSTPATRPLPTRLFCPPLPRAVVVPWAISLANGDPASPSALRPGEARTRRRRSGAPRARKACVRITGRIDDRVSSDPVRADEELSMYSNSYLISLSHQLSRLPRRARSSSQPEARRDQDPARSPGPRAAAGPDAGLRRR